MYRWYDLSFNILQNHEFVDYRNVVRGDADKRTVDDDDDGATIKSYPMVVTNEHEIKSVVHVLKQPEGQMLGLWSSDILRVEVTIERAIQRAGCRVMKLDFSNIVWAESLPTWLSTMDKTSNRTRTILKQLTAVIGGENVSSKAEQEFILSEENMDAILVEFRTLLAEKRAQMAAMQARDPSRPLVLFVRGVDSFLATVMKYGSHGRKMINVYLEYFLSYPRTVNPTHVVVAQSDKFWFLHWLKNDMMR